MNIKPAAAAVTAAAVAADFLDEIDLPGMVREAVNAAMRAEAARSW